MVLKLLFIFVYEGMGPAPSPKVKIRTYNITVDYNQLFQEGLQVVWESLSGVLNNKLMLFYL